MAGATVKVPIFGVQKRTTVYVVGGAVVVFLGVSFIRARGKNATPSTDPNAPAADGTIDPATGYAYGSAEDAAALASDSAYQNPVSYGGGGGPASTPAPATGFTSNAQWDQAAQTYLADNTELPGGTIGTALAKYLHGEGIVKGSTEDYIVLQAIASQGQPPQGGPNGFPPSIRHTTTPGEKPPPAAKATKLSRPSLRVSKVDKRHTSLTLSWGKVPGAAFYHLYNHDNLIATTASTSVVVGHGGTNFHVYAFPRDGDKTHLRSDSSNIVGHSF